MSLLAIDPGTRGCGVALFDLTKRELLAATYVRNTMKGGRRLDSAMAMGYAVEYCVAGWPGLPPTVVACEVPRSYDAGQQKGPQDDLIDLALVSACCASRFPNTESVTYYPAEWKSNLNAVTCLRRIVERAQPAERARIKLVGRLPLEEIPDSDSLDHNTLDAIGIGLFRLGRFAPARGFARE